jgi:acetyltransferase-like isoleucine patch superfamily enzyme
MMILFDLCGLSQLARRMRSAVYLLAALAGGRIHPSVRLGRNVSFAGPGAVSIGLRSSLRSDVVIRVSRGGSLRIGEAVEVGPGVRISVPPLRHMVIGDRVRLNQGCVLSGEITIERDCILAAHAYLVSDAHSFHDPKLNVDENDRHYGLRQHRIDVAEGSFIGAHALVFGPTLIGVRSIVGAGAMMTGTLPDEHLLKRSRDEVKVVPRRPVFGAAPKTRDTRTRD